jgi:mono/diheme cytochrome c family protein
MRRNGWKHWAVEGWAFVAVAAIAFAAGLLIGDLGGSSQTETVSVAASSNEGEEAGAQEGEAETETQGAASSPGAQVFAGASCGTCHTLAAAGSTGETGPDLNEFLAPDDTTEAVEEMIVDPNSELAEGYPANVMPKEYSQTLSKGEVHQLAEYLVANTPAKPDPPSSGGSGS